MPFKWWRGRYLCFYCGKTCTEYPDFKKHTKSHSPCWNTDEAHQRVIGNDLDIKIDVSEVACEICGEPFGCFDELVGHLIIKHALAYDRDVDISFQEYRLSDCRCLQCNRQFTYFGNLVSHVDIDHSNSSFTCVYCRTSFSKKKDLGLHLNNYHGKGGYHCNICQQVFKTIRRWRLHQKSCPENKIRCCQQTFDRRSLFRKHVQSTHLVDGFYKCLYCEGKWASIRHLTVHWKRCEVKLMSEDAKEPELSDDTEPKKQNVAQIRQNIACVLNMSNVTPFKFFAKYFCFYCSKKFTDFEELKVHTTMEHPVCELNSKSIKRCRGERTCVKIDVSNLACKVCCQPLLNFDVLIDHLVTVHDAEYNRSITGCFETFRIMKDKIHCPSCSQAFRYFSTLLRHMSSEHSGNMVICNYCGRSFKTVSNLNVHISYAHRGPVGCDVCSLKFKNQSCLLRHKAKSHDVKDFKCPKCPEMFQSHYQKQRHLITSHDDGHKCSYCGKMFTRNSFMRDHVRRMHLKEKNVPCTVCNEHFFDNYLLKLHMVKHEGEPKFVCAVCGKAFLRRSNLCSHIDVHKKYGHVQA